MTDFIVVQIIIAASLLLAWSLGIEVSWRLCLVLGLCGFATEMKEKIRVTRLTKDRT